MYMDKIQHGAGRLDSNTRQNNLSDLIRPRGSTYIDISVDIVYL